MNWHFAPTAILIAIMWSGFTVWAVRKFWRSPTDRVDKSYFTMGKFWAITMTVVLALAIPMELPLPGMSYWLEVAYFGFIGFPLAIIAGHFFSRTIQGITQRRSGK